MKQKILMVGTLPPPYQGQPIAFASAVEAIKEIHIYKVLSTSFQSKYFIGSIFKALKYFILLPYFLIWFRPKKIYFLCSRTFVGGLRDVYLILLFYFTDVKFYNHLHGSDFKIYIDSLPLIYCKFVKFIYKRVDHHAVLVEGMEEQLFDVSEQGKITVIPNFYENFANTNMRVLSGSADTINLVFLSSIVKTKGVFELIYAFKELRANNLNIHLFICGGFLSDSEMNQDEIQQKFISLVHQDEGITYLGLVNKQEKYEILSKSHIFVLPTYYRSEAVPLSIIEAMASGCAVVTTNYRYLPNIIQPKINGELVKVCSIKDLKYKLETLINDYNLLKKISENNKIIAKDLYSEKKYQNNIKLFLKG